MKYLNSWKLFEDIGQIDTIDSFLNQLGIDNRKKPQVEEWWNQNRKDFKIRYFPFNTTKPIAGVFLGFDEIAINQTMFMPPVIKLFLALHESRHCDQHRQGILMKGYYDTVVRGDKDSFLESYIELERDANDFAIQSMRECGFERDINMAESGLRMNERAGEMVYPMMRSDIQKYQPKDFIDLLKKQIGL